MDNALAAVLSLVTVALLIATALLLLDRGRRGARLAAAEGEAARSAERAEELASRLDGAERERDEQERRADTLDIERATLGERLSALRESHERELRALRDSEAEHRAELERRLEAVSKQLKDTFAASAQDAVDKSTKRLFEMAAERFTKQHDQHSQSLKDLVKPISDTLERTDKKIGELEKQRVEMQAGLAKHLESLGLQSAALGEETRRLTQALRKPQVRGRYGEIQLERVAELAGMTSYCDFDTQASSVGADGTTRRPDMVVKLPNRREIAVDAKTNIEPYLDALETDDTAEQDRHMQRFADGVLAQAHSLARKRYWTDYEGSPEFCVMFIPGDQFIDAALEREPKLLELAAQENILLASPSTLIGLLRAVAVGWREKNLSDAANELFALGRELHERAAVVLEHTADLGRHLGRTARSYDKLVGSMDARLTPTLRRFEDAGAKGTRELAEPKALDAHLRTPASLGEADASPAPGTADTTGNGHDAQHTPR